MPLLRGVREAIGRPLIEMNTLRPDKEFDRLLGNLSCEVIRELMPLLIERETKIRRLRSVEARIAAIKSKR